MPESFSFSASPLGSRSDHPVPPSSSFGLPAILLITAAVFGLSLVNGFVWDDGELLVPNEVYRRFDVSGILFGKANSLEYLPVRDITVALDAQIWGIRPFGFHLTNILLYLSGIAALHAMVKELAVLFSHTNERLLAFWATLFFALHPLNTEVVNFITARNTLLAGLFIFLSTALLMRGLRENRHEMIGASLFCYLLAAFSKAVVVFYPLFLLVLFAAVPRDKVASRKKIQIVTAFAVITAIAVWIHASNAADTGIMNDEVLRFGTGSVWMTLAKAVQIPFFYLRMLIVPHPLSVEYVVSFTSGAVLIRSLLAGIILLSALAGAWMLRKQAPMVTIGAALLFASLGPVLNLLPTHPVVADRYAYFAVAGCSIIIATLLTAPWARRKVVLFAAVGVLVVWAILDIVRTRDWRSDLSLWTSAIAADANTSRVNLALALMREGRDDEAIAELRDERRRKGTHYASLYEGKLLMRKGNVDAALVLFNRSLMEGGEAFREVRVSIAEAYEIKGDLGKALEHYLKAIEAKNIDVGGRHERAARNGLERIRTHSAALLTDLRTQARSRPGDIDAQAKAAFLLQTLGYYSEAEVFYRTALDIDPARWEMWYNLGLTQMRRRQYADAVNAFEKAFTLNPVDANILNNMGISFFHLKDYRQAGEYYRLALALDPRFFYASFNLGRLYFVTGDAERASEQFKKARAMVGHDPALQSRIDQYLEQLRKG